MNLLYQIKLLLTRLWRLVWWAGQKWLLLTASPQLAETLTPLVVVGALRMGGAGKTPVVNHWANALANRGRKVAVLVYAVHGRVPSAGIAVAATDDWRRSSDEAVWHAQQGKYAVWATRNRWRTWNHLSNLGCYDVIISDDGLADPRLRSAHQVLLDWGESGHSWRELFPAGKLRMWRRDVRVDQVVNMVGEQAQVRCNLVLPSGFPLTQPVVLVSAVGDGHRFGADMQQNGVQVVRQVVLRDHSPKLGYAVQKELAQGNLVAITAKDAIKLYPSQRSHTNLYIVSQEINIDLAVLDKYLAK